MEDKMLVWSLDVARRALLKMMVAGTAAGLSLCVVSAARALEKMSKQEAQYQDEPKDIRMCATCTLFEAPKSCKVVEGDVSPTGWCKAYALLD